MFTTHSEESPAVAAVISSKWTTGVGLGFVSLVYFADVFIRASHKLFWADELFTYYLCRLPSFKDTWAAVTHSVDFNPPLFYLLTRGSQWLFGGGLIASRLPAIVGLWLFGVCLFVFVKRRAGRVAGLIAGIFPFFTLAQYYAYEARPHGVTLGWCGLALVCWQMAGEGRRRRLWLAGFTLSFVGALLTHVYAVYLVPPFAIVVLYDLVKRRKLDWGVVISMAVALAVASPIYLLLFHNYRSMTSVGGLLTGPQMVLQNFFESVMGLSIVILLLSAIAFAVNWNRDAAPIAVKPGIPIRELLLAGAFAFLPLIVVIGVRITHGPFFDRYLLPSIAGYAIFLGFANSRRTLRSLPSMALATAMVLLMLGDLALAAWHTRPYGGFDLHEPVSKFTFSPNVNKPLAKHLLLAAPTGDEDILVLEQLDYIYLFRYAPPAVVPHLYFGTASADDMFIGAYGRLGKWAHLDMKTSLFGPFMQTHKKFLVYSTNTLPPSCGDCEEDFLSAGYALKSVRRDDDGVLFEYEKP